MGIIIRQSIKGSIVSFIGVGISAFTILFFYPAFLSPSQIGVLSFLEASAWTFLSFGSLGVYNMADKFFPQFKNLEQKHHGYFLFLVFYLAIGFLLAMTVLLVFKNFWIGIYSEKSPEAIDYFYYLIPFIFGLMYLSLLESYARIHLRIVVPTFYKEVIVRIFILFAVLGYGFSWYGFDSLVALRIAAFFVAMFGLILYLNHLKILFWKNPFTFLTLAKFREMAVYGFFIVLGGLSNLVISKVDILMIPAILSTNDLGVYTLAFFMGTVIEVPRKALGQISQPIIAQAWANQDQAMLQKIYRSSALNQTVVGVWLFLMIWLNVKAIFGIIPNGSQYIAGQYVVLLIAATRLVDMLTGVNSEILLQSKYYYFNLIALFILALMNISLNLVFIPYIGITGAALATLLAFIVFNFAKGLFLWIKFKMQPFSSGIFQLLSVGLFIVWLDTFFPSLEWLWLSIFIKSALITFFFGGTVLLLKISPEIDKLFLKALQLLRNV